MAVDSIRESDDHPSICCLDGRFEEWGTQNSNHVAHGSFFSIIEIGPRDLKFWIKERRLQSFHASQRRTLCGDCGKKAEYDSSAVVGVRKEVGLASRPCGQQAITGLGFVKRARIEEENRRMLRQQHDFRRAADIVTDALMVFEEVEAIAVIGSVAKSLWKEVPRFSEFRRAGIEVWHECKDLDLAVWISSQLRLGALRRARDVALRKAYESGKGPSTANHQVEIFLIEPGTDKYLGRLCNFNECPKGKVDCRVPGCGAVPFNKCVDGFVPHADLLASASYAMLYQRGAGRLRSALDLPAAGEASGPRRD